MVNQFISEATNSYHFFPGVRSGKPFSKSFLGIWPIEGQRFITNIDNFFDQRLLKEVSVDLKRMECVPNTLVGNRNIVRVPLTGDIAVLGLNSPIIVFDENCQLENKIQLREHLNGKRAPESIIDLFERSIEKMAVIGGWSKVGIPVCSFFLRYQLNEETPSVKDLPWHRDLNSLSMTALISPCKQDEGEFSGGDLFFAERTKDTVKYFDLPGSANTVLIDTQKELSYPENGCLIFENLWSQHKVSDIQKIAGDSCERILFSIFANPNPAQLTSFLDRNKAQNLAACRT